LFDVLSSRHGFGRTAQAPLLLYSGCSAGGRGVMYNLNRVAANAATISPGTTTIGLIDSGLYIDLEPVTEGRSTSLAEQAASIVTYTHADLDPSCVAVYAPESYKCLLGEYILGQSPPLLTVPHVINAFQFDSYQLDIDLPYQGRLDAEKLERHTEWASLVDTFRRRTLLVQLRASNATPQKVALFSPACYQHCNTETSSFTNGFKIRGTSLADVTNSLLSTTATTYVEKCAGFACGGDCRSSIARIHQSNWT